MNQTKTTTDNDNKNSKPAKTESTTTVPEWITETINGGSFRHVDLETGTNGWASPPGNIFSLRSHNYFTTKQKSPGGDYLLSLAAVDWLKSTTNKLDHILSRPDNRVIHALKTSKSNSFIFAVNFQIPGKEHYSLVFYYATQKPIPSDSLLHKFINVDDDSFRNERFKIVSNVVKGPWVVKAAAGKFGAFVVGKTVKCSYYRGVDYFEIDVDVSSSAILAALVRFMLGYITSLMVDVCFVVEAKTEEELPERLIGGARICSLELSSAFLVDDDDDEKKRRQRMMGAAEENDDKDEI
ncbi:Protein ENHANCED DISEASE RESISTANCE 2 C-terminal [Arabidopsis thaliana x Arabidopsis arenosa]|uniref:Protein ENHANCED DISEASE RESISTANCE 2 C-terminal n=1 Tax=Arabidopsis thaliana x Arabidopsis arenosa TaxID=1240361 RepID=A0A8T1YZB3_9BRAS|nr:Protein ENHANCED DISEASE RESISTANCE 2 C-terminal [Arabidopsis thaliana x Arabidopsis arenosa]